MGEASEWDRVTSERAAWAQRIGARRLRARARQLQDEVRQARLFPELLGDAKRLANRLDRKATSCEKASALGSSPGNAERGLGDLVRQRRE